MEEVMSKKDQKVQDQKIKMDEVIFIKGEIKDNVEAIRIKGDKTFIRFKGNEQEYSYDSSNVKIQRIANNQHQGLLSYFKLIARVKDSKPHDIPIKLEDQMNQLQVFPDSALNAFLTKKAKDRGCIKEFIYPFGMNLSQMESIERAFSSQVSVIEGPPGTGKTQTILNILANIVKEGKTAAVISNNNEAVRNIQEKMMNADYGFLLASLGKKENKLSFFNDIPTIPSTITEWENEETSLGVLGDNVRLLKELLLYENRLAKIIQQIKDLKLEQNYFEEHREHQENYTLKLLPFYKLSKKKILNMLVDFSKGSSIKRLKYLFFYGIYKFSFLKSSKNQQDFITEIQSKYYEQKIKVLQDEKSEIESKLRLENFQVIKNEIQKDSTRYFRAVVSRKYKNKDTQFQYATYKQTKEFEKFVRRFPITLSTAFSLKNSIPKEFMYDYLIIDEASQLELVPGIMALGCAKNVIVVGDRKQLQHIAIESAEVDAYPVESCYIYSRNSLLQSVLEVFSNTIPITLLKEHYRCDPAIIKFCNDRYYDGELITLSKDAEKPSLVLISTEKGNHMRTYGGNHNIRELESLTESEIRDVLFPNEDVSEVGFIAPFTAQIRYARNYLPEEAIRKTVHKFQGRERSGIIFSAVLDQTSSKQMMDFVQQEELINVAVSRAQNRFVLVCDTKAFKKNNGEIAELIRYMEYQEKHTLIHKSKVVSVFDLLYKEYSEVLLEREKKLITSDSEYRSEQIMASLLRDILSEEKYKKLTFKREYRLRDLIRSGEGFTEEEKDFISSNSRCDFLIHYKIGNAAAAVIEVDGTTFHNIEKPIQVKNDELKNAILKKVGIPLLRLRTNESGEEQKTKELLDGILSSKM